jgi:hypothetical protein
MHFRTLHALLLTAGLLLAHGFVFAQPASRPLPVHRPLTEKNFYLLTSIEDDSSAAAILSSDAGLQALAAERRSAARYALKSCQGEARCEIQALLWTDEEIHSAELALSRLTAHSPALQRFAATRLRSSGTYILLAQQSDPTMVAMAWEICARGLNEILSVYGQGVPPRYPMIDSSSVDTQSANFKDQLAAIMKAATEEPQSLALFFAPSLQAVSALLAANHRDEAARYEPMEADVNREAIAAIANTRWQSFPYTVIVVPGAGGTDADTPLSASGRERCILAAKAFHDGKAPFLLVSGGYVHPAQTRFSEAIEMKRALIADYHVPASAILVDPHARHTTTNMRNAAREIFRYGMPFDHPALMVSGAPQTRSIASPMFAERCLRELGYVPYRILKQESETSIAFLPLIESLQQDPIDPLDP